ncbi:MAG TPA: PDZ domain-containing protein [Blastocatellia bacterium]
MTLRWLGRLILATGMLAFADVAVLCQQTAPPAPAPVPWAVTVVHRVNLQKLIDHLEKEPKVSVGIMGQIAEAPLNITTGLVIDTDGHVVTRLGNLDPHDKDQDITVTTRDGSSHRAILVGVDGATGFAVLQVDSLKGTDGPLTAPAPPAGSTVRILSSDIQPQSGKERGKILIYPTLRVDTVKVGAPNFGANARGAVTLAPDLNPRSDSGIITTADNKVVGMVEVAALTPGNTFMFSLDSLKGAIVKRVLDKNESVPAGWLGVSGVAATQLPESERVPLGSTSGVVVKDVTPHSAAESAGIHTDDVIVGLDSFNINDISEMRTVLSACPAGEKIHVREIRQGKPFETDVVLGAQEVDWLSPAQYRVPADTAGYNSEEDIAAGFTSRDMTGQLAHFFGADAGTLVTSVVRGSLADRAGLAAGDVIVGTQNQAPLNARQLKSVFDSEGGPVTLKVIRKKVMLSIAIQNSPSASSPN